MVAVCSYKNRPKDPPVGGILSNLRNVATIPYTSHILQNHVDDALGLLLLCICIYTHISRWNIPTSLFLPGGLECHLEVSSRLIHLIDLEAQTTGEALQLEHGHPSTPNQGKKHNSINHPASTFQPFGVYGMTVLPRWSK